MADHLRTGYDAECIRRYDSNKQAREPAQVGADERQRTVEDNYVDGFLGRSLHGFADSVQCLFGNEYDTHHTGAERNDPQVGSNEVDDFRHIREQASQPGPRRGRYNTRIPDRCVSARIRPRPSSDRQIARGPNTWQTLE